MLDDTLGFIQADMDPPPPPRFQTTKTRQRSRSDLHQEYRLYFAIIFATLLPIAALTSLGRFLVSRGMRWNNPITTARRQTQRITPLIFAA